MILLIFWILSALLFGGSAYFLFEILKIRYQRIYKRWGHVHTDNFTVEKREFKMLNGNIIKVYSYGSTDFTGNEKMPGVIVIPRKGKKYPYFEHWGAHFALQGFPTLCIELNDKKLKLNECRVILRNIKEQFILEKEVDGANLVYFGVEESAKIALLEGLSDENIKIVCGLSMPKISEEEIQEKSGETKVCLVHCKDDKKVPFKTFEHNKCLLNLGETDFLTFDDGGHHIRGMEDPTSMFFSIKIHQALKPKYDQLVRRLY